MKHWLKVVALTGLLGACGLAQAGPTLIGVFTVDVSTIKSNIAFARCSRIITVPPDSDVISLYDDSTFTEDLMVGVTPYQITGTWGRVDGAKMSKFRFTYSGNPGDATGSWGAYVSNMATVAGVACDNTTVFAYGSTLRVLKAEWSVRTPAPMIGAGTATSRFQTELYGYDNDYDMYGKGTENTSKSGTFVWQ